MSFSEDVADLVERSNSDLVKKANEWLRAPMGSFVEVLNGFPFKSGQFSDADGEPIIRIRDVTAGQTKTYYRGEVPEGYWVQPGDLVVGMDGDFNSRIWQSTPGLLNQRVCKLSPDPTFMDVAFLAKVLPGYLSLINKATPSITVKHLSSKTLKETPIPVPPLPEQRRIVAKLDRLSARSAAARDHLARTTKLATRAKQAILSSAFDPDRHEIVVQVSEIAERVTKGASPKWQGFNYQTEGTLFVRSQNVGWGRLLLDEKAFLDEAFNDKQKNSVIQPCDVLLNIVGASIGRTAVATAGIQGANCNQAVAVIRLLKANHTDARFLNLWLQSPAAQDLITDGSVDVARANFSLASIKALALPWPKQPERSKIVRRIETAFARIDWMTEEASRAAHLLDRLDERLLAKAFRGELVPQDPEDEPARDLLARIREARAAAPKPKRGRRALA